MKCQNRQQPRIAVTVRVGLGAVLIVVLLQRIDAQGIDTGVPTVVDIEAKILEVQATTDLDDATKSRAAELYQLAIAQLKAHGTYLAALADYDALVDSAPTEIERLQAEREAAEAAPVPLADKPVSELEQELTRAQGELASEKGNVQALEQRIAMQQQRPAAARAETADAQARLEQVEKELKLSVEEETVLAEARQMLLNVRQLARRTELRALEQELVTYELRQRLYQAQRETAAGRVVRQEKRVRRLEEELSARRRAEAEAARQAADRARAAASGKHPAVRALTDENLELSRELETLTRSLEQTQGSTRRNRERLEELQNRFDRARKTIEEVGLSDILGEILLEQRRQLPLVQQYRKSTAERNERLAVARVRSYRVEQRKAALEDGMGGVVATTLRNDTTPPNAADVERLQQEVRAVLSDQLGILRSLDRTYGLYRHALAEIDSVERGLLASARDFGAFLDEHLLWTPSVPRLGAGTTTEFLTAVQSFFAPHRWREALRSIVAQARSHAVLSGLVVLATLLLVVSRRFWRRRLESIASDVRRPYTDHLFLTVRALLITVILAAPLPLFFGYTAWLLLDAFYAPPFVRSVGSGLATVAGLAFFLRCLRAFFATGGVADVHFHWRETVLLLFRRNLLVFGGALLGTAFVVAVASHNGDRAHHYTVGRLAFLAAMLLLSLLVVRVFRPRGGVLESVVKMAPSSWLTRLRYVWFSVAVGAPLCLGGLAAAGYYYTARELTLRLVATAGILFGAVVLYNAVRRWVFIARMRLAIERARERREASQEAEERQAGSELTVELDIPDLDLEKVKDQTLYLARTSLVIGSLVGIALVWAGVLPALGALDFQIGSTLVRRGMEEAVEPIRLSHLLSAILVVAITLVSAKNLPGFLEVAVLRHTPLDPGSRYAASTIAQYALTAAGLMFGFHLLGIGWSQVQWLVAALSVGLGFGLQEIFANMVSGVIILLERPVRVGDTVTIGEISGTVTRIRIRATTITDWDQKELVVPNKSFITGQLVNWSLSNPVTRLTIRVGIAYGSDTELALKLMLAAAKANTHVLAEPEPGVFFVGFGDSSLDFHVRVFVKELTNRGRSRVIHELHLAIDQSFREHGVVIAFPQRDIHIKASATKDAEQTDPRE